MQPEVDRLSVYRELADWYEQRTQPPMRDRFLVLAAVAALDAGQTEEAERLRQRLLQANPHHLLKPYASLAQALETPDVKTYVHTLQRNYPPEVAEGLLRTLRASQGQAAPPLPPTSPISDAGSAKAPPGDREQEALKVYPLRPESERLSEGIPPTLPPQKGRPAPTTQSHTNPPGPTPFDRSPSARSPGTPSRSVPSRQVPPTQPAPRGQVPMATAPAPSPESIPAGTAWLSTILVGILFLVGAALALYTLARPFLPPLK